MSLRDVSGGGLVGAVGPGRTSSFWERLTDVKDIDVSFSEFPYYLGNYFIDSSYTRLNINSKSEKLTKLKSKLPTLCPRTVWSRSYYVLIQHLFPVFQVSDVNDEDGRPNVIGVPAYGSKGEEVLLTVGGQVGVRFDQKISKGVDLGGKCEKVHDFFFLQRPTVFDKSVDNELVIDMLFEIVSLESERGSMILLVKDIEKLVNAIPNFKMKLEALPINVVVIASHTRVITQKDRVCY
ncbi:hypothetical protein OROHE_013394 [Orobanche hederae]